MDSRQWHEDICRINFDWIIFNFSIFENRDSFMSLLFLFWYTNVNFDFLISEQLEKIEAGMDSIYADMQIAEKALKGMELCCGIFPKFWKK